MLEDSFLLPEMIYTILIFKSKTWPNLPNFLAKWVGRWVKAHISSQKILSQKEAELVLVGKEIRWSHLLLQDRDFEPQNIGYTCADIHLFFSSQLIRIYDHKFFKNWCQLLFFSLWFELKMSV